MLLMTSSSSSQTAGFIIALVVWGVAAIGMYVWYGLALSRLFPKLGSRPRKGWIPIANEAEIFTLGGVPGWSVVWYFVPIMQIYAIVLRVKATSRINAAFGRGQGMTVLAVVLAPLWATILASSQPLTVKHRIAPRPAEAITPATFAGGSPTPPSGSPTRPTGGLGQTIGAGTATTPAPTDATPPVPAAASPELAAEVVALAPPSRISPYLGSARPETRPSADSRPAHAAPPPTPPATAPAPAPAPARTDEPTPVTAHQPWIPSPAAASPTLAPVTTVSPSPVAPVPVPFPAPLTAQHTAAAPLPTLAAAAADAGANDGEEDGETVFVDRRPKIVWRLRVEGAGEFPLLGEHVLLGRKPTTALGTQALTVPDTTRTISKVHARLDLVDGEWGITDLNSTNGVIIVSADGTERLLGSGESASVSGPFILGKVAMSIAFERPSA